jgi:hypothetical protein
VVASVPRSDRKSVAAKGRSWAAGSVPRSARQSPPMGKKTAQDIITAPIGTEITRNMTTLKWNTYLRAITRGPESHAAICHHQVYVECGTPVVLPAISRLRETAMHSDIMRPQGHGSCVAKAGVRRYP